MSSTLHQFKKGSPITSVGNLNVTSIKILLRKSNESPLRRGTCWRKSMLWKGHYWGFRHFTVLLNRSCPNSTWEVILWVCQGSRLGQEGSLLSFPWHWNGSNFCKTVQFCMGDNPSSCLLSLHSLKSFCCFCFCFVYLTSCVYKSAILNFHS